MVIRTRKMGISFTEEELDVATSLFSEYANDKRAPLEERKIARSLNKKLEKFWNDIIRRY